MVSPLNPYEAGADLLKLEEVNFSPAGERTPLLCIAISAKRYVEFNKGPTGELTIRKASAHGLGHYMPPYKPDEPEVWQNEYWKRVIAAHLAGTPNNVNLVGLPGMELPVAIQFSATTPHFLNYFKFFNKGKTYSNQVKPNNFLLAFQCRNPLLFPEIWADYQDLDPRTIKPIAPYNRNILKGSKAAFDRHSGKKIPRRLLKTYGDVLAEYHLHPERKFLNARTYDCGATQRRLIEASPVRYIGKEADRLEERLLEVIDEDATVDYNVTPETVDGLRDHLKKGIAQHGLAEIAEKAGLSDRFIRQVADSQRNASPKVLTKISRVLYDRAQLHQEQVEQLLRLLQKHGVRKLAALAEIDASNLQKMGSGKRPISKALRKWLAETGAA